MEDIQILSHLFRNYYGVEPASVDFLPGAGSDRHYYRLRSASASCIGVAGDSLRDCRAFLRLSEVFDSHGINVPQVYAVSDCGKYYLQRDLGDVSLFSLIGEGAYAYPRGRKIITEALRNLARLQTVDYEEWKDAVSYKEFSRRQVLWDLNYFKYEYLKPAAVDFDEDALEDDFDRLGEILLSTDRRLQGFMYRDCQSRNVMVMGDKPWWIDFQGGRLGPCVYDAVSFLWQAKARFDDAFRKEMLEVYAEEFAGIRGIDSRNILDMTDIFVLFRLLQVLGAYGFRGLVQKRAHFVESIPAALENLRVLIDKGVLDCFPELLSVCRLLVDDARFLREKRDRLRVKVFSFSYKKGYPEDFSGNGGGFMFDCRGMHNPGRYDEYKPLTGRDLPVKRFLEERGEAAEFIGNAYRTVAPSVEKYLKRGFSDLQIGFGCTGGRHRSVYCADAVARKITDSFPEAEVEVIHRERGWRELISEREDRQPLN